MRMKHEKKLQEFIRRIVEETNHPNAESALSGFMSGRIPESLLTLQMRQEGPRFVVLSGQERDSLYSCLKELRADSTTEYLSNEQLKDRLWKLACEICLDTSSYNTASKQLTKAQEFLSTLCQPVKQYEVMFRIENLDMADEQIEIWGSQLKKYSAEELHEWGLKTTMLTRKALEEFKNQTLITVNESGTNPNLVHERARKSARFKLRVLQSYLSGHEFVQDEQLLFELSELATVKDLQTDKIVSVNWSRARRAIPLQFGMGLESYITEETYDYAIIKQLQPRIKEIVERAIYWIAQAIFEEAFDLKISALCTAMETLLTTRDDRRKGEAIAYRMVLLEALLKDDIRHPGEVLWLYELRSLVVHGSRLNETSESEYQTLLRDARKTLRNYINIANRENLAKPAKLFRILETSNHAKMLIDWLDNFTDEHSTQVKEALRQARAAHEAPKA